MRGFRITKQRNRGNIGGGLSKMFGGGNSFKPAMSPTVASPKREGESDKDYANRLYLEEQSKERQGQAGISAAQNQGIRGDVLDFGQANQTAGFQNDLNTALQGRMGRNIDFSAANQTLGQNQGLINQLLAQGRGEGPNPALDQLRMTTDQNARQGAAMAASQRGINPALAARMASQGVAGANQSAAGQAALQSAQQQQQHAQLLAQNLQGQRGQDISQATSQGQAGLNLLTANTNTEMGRRQAELARQAAINNVYSSNNAVAAGVASQNAATNFQYGAGAMSGLSSALATGMGMAEGGEVPNPFMEHVQRKNFDMGGQVPAQQFNFAMPMEQGPSPVSFYESQKAQAAADIIKAGEKLSKSMSDVFGPGTSSPQPTASPQPTEGGGDSMESLEGAGMGDFTGAAGTGIQGEGAAAIGFASKGGKVNGKPKVGGDSTANDTVPAMLSPGEIVIPRSATQSPEEAHAFLDQIIRQQSGPDYREVMNAKVKYHNMAHGGDVSACPYCYGGRA